MEQHTPAPAPRRGGPGGSGRRKIPIEKIAKNDARQVCFSKRRKGLFKKAAELSTLCGAHIGVLVFSPGGKPYTFGNPSVDAVIDHYMDPSLRLASQSTEPLLETTQVEKPVQEMGLEELVVLKEMMVEMRKQVIVRIKEIEEEAPPAAGMIGEHDGRV